MYKHYIKDFVEDFNYSGIMLYASDSVNLEHLRAKLKEDNLSHLYSFDVVLLNRMFIQKTVIYRLLVQKVNYLNYLTMIIRLKFCIKMKMGIS